MRVVFSVGRRALASAICESEMSFAVIFRSARDARTCVHGTPAPQPSSSMFFFPSPDAGVESRAFSRVLRCERRTPWDGVVHSR